MNHPILSLRQERAAKSLDISLPTFKNLVEQGILPRPIKLGTIQVWRADELDKALCNLPRAGERIEQRDTAMEALAAMRKEAG